MTLRTAYAHYRTDVLAQSKAAVEEGGGIWVGIQDCRPLPYSLVLFNSKKTGSTVALKTTEITSALVRSAIAASDKKFRTQRSTILEVREKI